MEPLPLVMTVLASTMMLIGHRQMDPHLNGFGPKGFAASNAAESVTP